MRPFNSSPALYYKWSIVTMHLSCTVVKIWRLKDNGSRTWLFGVTWRHRSRDCSTLRGQLFMGSSYWPCVYLAPLWRYGASNIGRTDRDRKKDGRMERERGRGGEGKGKAKWKGKRKGKGKEKKMERQRVRDKGKGRWKEDSLRNVGRTDGHKGDFIL